MTVDIEHFEQEDYCPEYWYISDGARELVDIVLDGDDLIIKEYGKEKGTVLFSVELDMSSLQRAKERLDTVFHYYRPNGGIREAERIEEKIEEIVAEKTDFVSADSL